MRVRCKKFVCPTYSYIPKVLLVHTPTRYVGVCSRYSYIEVHTSMYVCRSTCLVQTYVNTYVGGCAADEWACSFQFLRTYFTVQMYVQYHQYIKFSLMCAYRSTRRPTHTFSRHINPQSSFSGFSSCFNIKNNNLAEIQKSCLLQPHSSFASSSF